MVYHPPISGDEHPICAATVLVYPQQVQGGAIDVPDTQSSRHTGTEAARNDILRGLRQSADLSAGRHHYGSPI